MGVTRRGSQKTEKSEDSNGENENGGGKEIVEYEESRAQRIKQNMDRMKSLGILDLSKKLKPEPKRQIAKTLSQKKKPARDDPPRRSTRCSITFFFSKHKIRHYYFFFYVCVCTGFLFWLPRKHERKKQVIFINCPLVIYFVFFWWISSFILFMFMSFNCVGVGRMWTQIFHPGHFFLANDAYRNREIMKL